MIALALAVAAVAGVAPSVAVTRVDGATRFDVRLAADEPDSPEVRGLAFPRGPAGGREIWFLADTLVRLELEEPPAVRAALPTLPADDVILIAADADGDTIDEIYLAASGTLWQLDPEAGRAVAALEAPGLDVEPWRTRFSPRSPQRATFPVFRRGRLRFVTPGANAPASAIDVAAPGQVHVWERTIARAHPQLVYVGDGSDGAPAFATLPESIGERRLHGLLVRPQAGEVVDWWGALPEPERLLGYGFARLDGEPVLTVTTTPADHLTLFGERRLRIFPLREDRSRGGHAPVVAFETRANVWQWVKPVLGDRDGDGRDDLVLGYWKGLTSSRVTLDLYLRRADGSFASSPRTTSLDVPKGRRDWLSFGDDIDGDGLADLAVATESELRIHLGVAGKRLRKGLVEDRPAWRLSLARPADESLEVVVSTEGAAVGDTDRPVSPLLVELDGSPPLEVVVPDPDGRGFSIFRIDRRASP